MHDSYVFWLNGCGGERVSLGGSSDILQPDSFGVVAPGEVHANHAVTEHRTLESLYVTQDAIDAVAAQMGQTGNGFRSRLQKDADARHALGRLHAILMETGDPFLARQSFVEVFSLLLQRHGEDISQGSLANDSAKVHMARTTMTERFSEQLELDELARLCGCSACHLIRLFRREVGMTPHAYLMELRLGRARELLAGHRSLGRVAAETGFADQSHMTRRFAARFGITPGQYRHQIST